MELLEEENQEVAADTETESDDSEAEEGADLEAKDLGDEDDEELEEGLEQLSVK